MRVPVLSSSVLLVLITPIALVISLCGQSPGPLPFKSKAGSLIATAPHSGDSLNLKVTTNLVQIPVTVLNDADDAVDDLTKDNFLLYENGAPQTISHFEAGQAPMSAGLG